MNTKTVEIGRSILVLGYTEDWCLSWIERHRPNTDTEPDPIVRLEMESYVPEGFVLEHDDSENNGRIAITKWKVAADA